MRKKIILGIVIFVILAAAIIGAVYFNMNYAVVERNHGDKMVVRTDVTEIKNKKYDLETTVKCTPSLKKMTKLEKLWIIAEEDMDLSYLSEMKNLNTLIMLNLKRCRIYRI